MARISIRDLFRIRQRQANLTYRHRHRRCHQSLLLLPSSKHYYINASLFSCPYHSSFPYIEDRPIEIDHPGIRLLRSCRSTRHVVQIHAQLIACGLAPFWSARLLKHSLDFGDIDYTVLIFRYIDSPGTFCANNVIKGYSLSSIPERAVVFYFEMLRNGFSPNSYTFVWLVGSCAKARALVSGQKCHGQAVKNGVDRVLPVQNSLIHLYCCCGVMAFGRKLLDETSHRDLVSCNSILSGYASAGEMGLAFELFDVMPERNVVSWNIMISGCLKGNNPGRALMLFRRMVETELRGNDQTMVSVLSACGRSARPKEGRSVHGFVIKTLSKLSVILYTSLIDMYSKCSKVEVAQRIFDKMVDRNLVSWNAIILGHCIHGNPTYGLNLFEQLVDQAGSGVRETMLPDAVTYIGVLCSCARAGLLAEGRNFFSEMSSLNNIKPNFAHYWCMANLYAGAGLLQEAEDVLRNMPEDDEDSSSESLLWANLLSLCRFQENASFGERIAKSLIEMEPQNFSHYQLLMNVYAVAGQWDDVVRVKDMVRARGIGRIPRCNLVDLKHIVHNYKAAHHWQNMIGESNMMLDEMVEKQSL